MRRALLLLALCPTLALADQVILKSGGRLSGRILSRTDQAVEIDVGAGTVSVPLASVERIEEGQSALQQYQDRAGRLAPNDHLGWLELARWASSRGLGAPAREAYNRVLASDPGNAEANQALGRVQGNDGWVSKEESYRARGYVQFEGEWMASAQRDAIEHRREARARSDRRQAELEVRVREAEERAAKAEADAAAAKKKQDEQQGIPLWWGTWGPGPTAWPGAPQPTPLPSEE